MADQTSILQVNVDLGTSTQTVGQLRDEFDSLTASEGKATDASEKFNFTNEEAIAISGRYSDSLKQVQQQVEQTTAEISSGMQSAAASTQQFAASTQQAQQQFSTANAGFLNSLTQQRVAFTDLGRIVTGQGFTLRSLSSNFALLGPQVVIAAAAIGFIGEKLIDYVKNANDVVAINDKIVQEAAKNLDPVIGQVNILAATINDVNTSTKERKDAIDELIKQHPNYFSNLKDEQNITAKLTEDTNKFTQAIEQEAIAKAASAELTKVYAEKFALAMQEEQTAEDLRTGKLQELANSMGLDAKKLAQDQHDENLVKEQDLDRQLAVITKIGVRANQNVAALGGDTGKPKKQATDKHAQDLQELRQYEDSIAEVTSDARTKELAAAQKQYDSLAAKFKDFADLETRLAQDYRVKVAAINAKYDALDAAAIAKLEADELKQQAKYQDEQGKIVDEYEQKRKKADQNNRANDLALENAAYQKAIDAAMEVGEDLTAVEDAHRREIAQINQDWDAKDLKQAEEATSRQIALIRELYKAGDKGTAIERDENRIAELNAIKKALNDELAAVGNNAKQQEVIRKQLVATNTQLTAADGQLSKDRIAQQDQELTEVGQILNRLAALAGKNTETGKDLAVAATIISTYAAAQKAYESQFLPVPDISSPVRGAIAAAVAVAAGLENVKQIESVSIPGGSGGGSASASLPSGGGGSYSGPTLPSTSTQTNLSQQSINQISDNLNNNPTKVVVLESDITASQQRVLGYQQASVL